MVHHHLRKKIQFKRSHDGKISFLVFRQASKTITINWQVDQKAVVNSRLWNIQSLMQGIVRQPEVQKRQKKSVLQQPNPQKDPIHWNTKYSKQNLAGRLCFRGERGKTDRHKVTGLQVGFPGAGTETGTNHCMEIMGTEGWWDHWGQREKWQFGVPQSKCWWSIAFVNISPRPADLAAASDKQGVRLMVIRPSGQREWKREWIVLPSQ